MQRAEIGDQESVVWSLKLKCNEAITAASTMKKRARGEEVRKKRVSIFDERSR